MIRSSKAGRVRTCELEPKALSQAERWIAEGRVIVNGNTLTTPATLVTADDDVIVDGKRIKNKPPTPRLFVYHKPAGLVTSHRDEKGRATVFDRLPRDLPRVISVGRLDLDSEGLLLLTTSGALARAMELPKNAQRYIEALERQAQVTREFLGDFQVAQVAVGGGTPSFLEAPLLARALRRSGRLGAAAWALLGAALYSPSQIILVDLEGRFEYVSPSSASLLPPSSRGDVS